MTDEENKGVVAEEQSEPQAVAAATESETTQEVRQDEAADQRKRNDQEYNWAEARRKMQELERQIKDRDQVLDQIQKNQQPKEKEDDFGIEDDALVEGKHIKDLKKEIRDLKKNIQKKEAASVEDRVKARFSDYDAVVTQENIETLKQKKPELALSLAHNPDPYAQAVAVYDAIKLTSEHVIPQQSNLEKEKATKNSQKPVSVNAAAKQSALGNAHIFENGLTPELKKQLFKEMQDAAKRT